MNAFFPVTLADTGAVFAGVKPEFVRTEPNVAAVDMAAGGWLQEVIGADARHVVNGTSAGIVGALFMHLLRYRAKNYATFAKKCKASEVFRAAALAGNVALTSKCTWRVRSPEALTIVTSTADEELVVVGWAWGVMLCEAGLRLIETARTAPRPRGDLINAIAEFRCAATVFRYLRMRAPGEMTARFQPFGPMCSKSYACAAYEAMALALAYVAAANIAIAGCVGKTLDARVPALLREADITATRGLALLKNEDGADDVGIELPVAYAHVALGIHAAARFYNARNHAAEPTLRQLAHRHMVAAADLDEAAPMRVAMTAIADIVDRHHDGAISTSLMQSFARFVMPSPAQTTVGAVRLAALAALPPLPEPDAPFEVIEGAPVQALLFPPHGHE